MESQQMETMQIKFDNFKRFLAEAVPQGSIWLSLMASVLLDTFLCSIYERAEAELGWTIEQITNKVLVQAGLQRGDFTPAQIEKFSLYCKYFLQISQRVYKQ
jgi:hypothetical protein